MQQISDIITTAKDQLTRTNTKDNLIRYQKPSELPPLFIHKFPELMDAFSKTDLGYGYVLEHYKVLEAAKRDSLPEETMQAWYCMMLQRHWEIADFNKAFGNLLKSKTFGTVKWDDWVQEEVIYTESELKVRIKQELEKMLQQAKFYKANKDKLELTEEEENLARWAAYNELKTEYSRNRSELMENYKNEFKQKVKAEIKRKEDYINAMSLEQKKDLLNHAYDKGEIAWKTEFEYECKLNNLSAFAGLISMESIKEI